MSTADVRNTNAESKKKARKDFVDKYPYADQKQFEVRPTATNSDGRVTEWTITYMATGAMGYGVESNAFLSKYADRLGWSPLWRPTENGAHMKWQENISPIAFVKTGTFTVVRCSGFTTNWVCIPSTDNDPRGHHREIRYSFSEEGVDQNWR